MDPNASNKPETIDIWVVERRLGTGGMGTVYRCHNRHAPKIKAAIKVLANHLQASDTGGGASFEKPSCCLSWSTPTS